MRKTIIERMMTVDVDEKIFIANGNKTSHMRLVGMKVPDMPIGGEDEMSTCSSRMGLRCEEATLVTRVISASANPSKGSAGGAVAGAAGGGGASFTTVTIVTSAAATASSSAAANSA